MEKVSFLILIVLYKLSPEQSKTILSLRKCVSLLGNSRIVVRDNSPEPISNESLNWLKSNFNEVKDVSYVFNNRNESLSSIYNETIKLLDKKEYLVLLDHDSEFAISYFEEAVKAISSNPQMDLFLPLIYQNQTIVSPSTMILFKGIYWKKERVGVVPSKHAMAINSCMIVSARYLKTDFPGYNTALRFYSTDNDFMLKYEQRRSSLYVLPCRIHHSLDFYNGKESFDKKSKRFIEVRSSFLLLMRQRGWFIWLISKIYFFLYSIKFAMQQRDYRYIFL